MTDEDIGEREYRHAQKVWKTFRIKNMGQYHDLYLQSDVFLLSDVFQNFREACLFNYGLDPCHYITSPGLAWDAMLKMTKVNLDLISDIETQLFIEKGMRGGLGGIASAIGTGGISLVAISTVALLVKGYMEHQSLDIKIQTCTYAYQKYQHLLILIKNVMRSGALDKESLINSMTNIDNFVTDNSSVVDKFF